MNYTNSSTSANDAKTRTNYYTNKDVFWPLLNSMIMILPMDTKCNEQIKYSRRDVGSWKELFSLPKTVVMIEFELIALACRGAGASTEAYSGRIVCILYWIVTNGR